MFAEVVLAILTAPEDNFIQDPLTFPIFKKIHMIQNGVDLGSFHSGTLSVRYCGRNNYCGMKLSEI